MKMAEHFLSVQLGFGVPRATESAVHAARQYVSKLQPGFGLLKLDFSNAFNSIRRDVMFTSVLREMPELYPFVHLCYNNASLLSFGEFMLQSDEGAQQGNPLGPLLFCVSIMDLASTMTSELNIWYLDDGTIGGQLNDLLHDLDTVRRVGPTLGLQLNEDKWEIVTNDGNVASSFRAVMPNIQLTSCSDAILLGAPIGDISAIDTIPTNKLIIFQCLASRLTTLGAHDALFLLKNCFEMPKLLYTLRSAPCYQSSILIQYDTVIRQTLQLILNLDLTESVWNQAMLPVSKGGLGVRLATDLALPAFLSSVAGASTLTVRLLPNCLHDTSGLQDIFYTTSCIEWQTRCNSELPDTDKIGSQKAWDSPLVSKMGYCQLHIPKPGMPNLLRLLHFTLLTF